MNSLRRRLTLLLLTGLAVLITVVAAILYPSARAILVAEYDYALLAKVRALTTLSGTDRKGVSLQFTERILPEFQPRPDAEYFQVWLRDGSVLDRSPSLGEADLRHPSGLAAQPRFWNLALPDGRSGRAVGLGLISEGVQTGAEPDFIIVLARERVRLDRTMAGLLTGLIVGGLALMLTLAWLVRRSIRAGLRPVEALAEQVMAVGAESLGTRFPVAELPRELRPIAEQLNQLLERLRTAFERERRFSANAAHELATPVAELRALAEVALGTPGTSEAGLARDALEIAQEMQRMVEGLLALTRSESQLQKPRHEPVDVTRLIGEVADALASRADARGLRWAFWLAPGVTVNTDPTMFRSMIVNLAENAVEYTPSGGEVSGQLETQPNGFLFTLANTTDNLIAADLPHLFEPLWRKDAARTDRGHAGLGLALVKAMAESLGMKIRAELIQTGELQMTLRQPANGSPKMISRP